MLVQLIKNTIKIIILLWLASKYLLNTMLNIKNAFQILFFKKKSAHAYFGRPYFSKSFGGKILEIWTAFTMQKMLSEMTEKNCTKQLQIFLVV